MLALKKVLLGLLSCIKILSWIVLALIGISILVFVYMLVSHVWGIKAAILACVAMIVLGYAFRILVNIEYGQIFSNSGRWSPSDSHFRMPTTAKDALWNQSFQNESLAVSCNIKRFVVPGDMDGLDRAAGEPDYDLLHRNFTTAADEAFVIFSRSSYPRDVRDAFISAKLAAEDALGELRPNSAIARAMIDKERLDFISPDNTNPEIEREKIINAQKALASWISMCQNKPELLPQQERFLEVRQWLDFRARGLGS